ncbi:MAG: hypothetical protein O9340_01705 [Cyclobacteriaceae bacterium]|jgi:hypothetical protein|nr:hypothetical protein [Cyclobacteriaceae bacterium]
MEAKLKYLLFLFWLASFQAIGQNPGEYLQQISSEYTKVNHEMMSYISAVSHGKSARKIDKRRTELVKQIILAESNIRKMKGFNGKTVLRDSVVAYFDLSEKVLNKRYSQIMDLEAMAEDSYDNMELYLAAKEKAEVIMENAGDRIDSIVSIFAKENNIKLVEGSSNLSKKLAKASKVNEYYNKIYLLYFKCYKDDAYLFNAIEKGSTIEQLQFSEQMKLNAKENLEKLKLTQPFAGDETLKTACRNALEFFTFEGNNVKIFTDFTIEKEKFEKIKQTFEKKSEANRTKKDFDEYNSAVANYNKALGEYNKQLQVLNKKRNDTFNNWEKMSSAFLNKHVPRY